MVDVPARSYLHIISYYDMIWDNQCIINNGIVGNGSTHSVPYGLWIDPAEIQGFVWTPMAMTQEPT